MNRIMLLLVATIIAASASGCGKPNPLGPDIVTTISPSDTTCTPDTLWGTPIRTNTVSINTDHPRGVLVEGLTITCPDNIVSDTLLVNYSDTYDQTLTCFLEDVNDASRVFSLSDSTGSSIINQPPNYRGTRRLILTARNVTPGTYQFVLRYEGTIRSVQPLPASVAHPYSVLWHVESGGGTVVVGCLVCR